jgi:sugar phosphate permease
MGYRATTAQLFTVPPNMAAFFTVLITAYYSDKVKNRGYFIVGGAIIGICGYIMLLVAKTNAVRYAGTFLVAIGVFQGSPMIMVCTLRMTCRPAVNERRLGYQTTSHHIMSARSQSVL